MIDIVRRAVIDEYRPQPQQQQQQGFTFSRNSLAYDDYGRLYYPHQLRYVLVDGRTGVLVEESTTNLRVRSDLMDGVAASGPSGEITVSTVSVPLLGYQTQTRRVSRTGSVWWTYAEWYAGIVSSAAYAVSVYIKPDTVVANEISRVVLIEPGSSPQRSVGTQIKWDSNGMIASLTPIQPNWSEPLGYGYEPAGDGWYRVWFVCPADVDPSRSPRVRIIPCESGDSVTDKAVLVGGVQVEQKNYLTSLMPTSGSATTRAAETLTVPTSGVVSPTEGTIEVWAYVDGKVREPSAYRHIFNLGRGNGGTGIHVNHIKGKSTWQLQTRNDADQLTSVEFSDSYTPDGWHYFAVTWAQDYAKVYVDGQLRGTITSPLMPSSFGQLFIGSSGSGTNYANTIFSTLRISRRARTDQEIAEAYAAGTLTADADTTLLLDFSKGPYVRRAAKVIRAV